jgi:hypothetical protein
MKVRMIVEGERRNPEFDRQKPRVKGVNWPTNVVPIGEEIEHPDAWMLCLPVLYRPGKTAAPQAEPLDDEAKAKVAEELTAYDRRRDEKAARDKAEEADKRRRGNKKPAADAAL